MQKDHLPLHPHFRAHLHVVVYALPLYDPECRQRRAVCSLQLQISPDDWVFYCRNSRIPRYYPVHSSRNMGISSVSSDPRYPDWITIMFSLDKKNSLIGTPERSAIFSRVMSTGRSSSKCFGNVQTLLIISYAVEKYPGIFFSGNQQGVDPAPYAVPVTITVMRGYAAQILIDHLPEAVIAAACMDNSPVFDYQKDSFFSCFIAFLHPETAVFFIAIRIEEFTIEGVVPFLAFPQEQTDPERKVPGVSGKDRLFEVTIRG